MSDGQRATFIEQCLPMWTTSVSLPPMVTLGIHRSTPAGMFVKDLLGSDGPVVVYSLLVYQRATYDERVNAPGGRLLLCSSFRALFAW